MSIWICNIIMHSCVPDFRPATLKRSFPPKMILTHYN